jgi:hypothetical protein
MSRDGGKQYCDVSRVRSRTLSPLHLCLCRLRLGQPERHLHGTVEEASSGQRGTGLLPLAGLGIQRAEAAVAVGLEWAHAQLIGEGQRLLVVGFGLLGV